MKVKMTLVLKQPYSATRRANGVVDYEAEELEAEQTGSIAPSQVDRFQRTMSDHIDGTGSVWINTIDGNTHVVPNTNIAYITFEKEEEADDAELEDQLQRQEATEASGTEDDGAARPDARGDGGPPAGQGRRY